jgi:hypothetical protein
VCGTLLTHPGHGVWFDRTSNELAFMPARKRNVVEPLSPIFATPGTKGNLNPALMRLSASFKVR